MFAVLERKPEHAESSDIQSLFHSSKFFIANLITSISPSALLPAKPSRLVMFYHFSLVPLRQQKDFEKVYSFLHLLGLVIRFSFLSLFFFFFVWSQRIHSDNRKLSGEAHKRAFSVFAYTHLFTGAVFFLFYSRTHILSCTHDRETHTPRARARACTKQKRNAPKLLVWAKATIRGDISVEWMYGCFSVSVGMHASVINYRTAKSLHKVYQCEYWPPCVNNTNDRSAIGYENGLRLQGAIPKIIPPTQPTPSNPFSSTTVTTLILVSTVRV